MKTLSTITLIILFLAACKSNIEPFEQKFALIEGNQIRVPQTTTWLKITKVEQNLCPPNAQCIAIGGARIYFRLISEGYQSDEKKICINCDFPNTPVELSTTRSSTSFNGKEITVKVDSATSNIKYFYPTPLFYFTLQVK